MMYLFGGAFSMTQVFLFHAFIFFYGGFDKFHKQGLRGGKLWEEAFLNRWRDYMRSVILVFAIIQVATFINIAYCDKRDFENESKFNCGICATERRIQEQQKHKEIMLTKKLEHEERVAVKKLKT